MSRQRRKQSSRSGQKRSHHRSRPRQPAQRKPVPEGVFEAPIEKLGHDGRGIARIDGKTTFIAGALAGELVEFTYLQCHSRYDEATIHRIIEPSSQRVSPPCEHASACGGCSLQHLNTEAQLALKQSVLLEQLQHFGAQQPEQILKPLVGGTDNYRRRARLSIKHTPNNKCIVGFREKGSNQITAIHQCLVLMPQLSALIPKLQPLLEGLQDAQVITHIDIVRGDDETALTFRHVKPLTEKDSLSLLSFCQRYELHLYLQPNKSGLANRVWPDFGDEQLSYGLVDFDAKIHFHPSDFIQVNAVNNAKLVKQAFDLLDVNADDRVLDLFCGVGNFTLPLATKAAEVVGVEGNSLMVSRGNANASYNQLSNIEFYGADLTQELAGQPWARKGFNKVLIDPPRAGALDVVRKIALFSPEKIVYVSCNPATLARDAGELSQLGYKMIAVGVADMFPHTTHVESIALFEPRKA